MDPRPAPNKLATTSLILGLLGWAIYLLQWCFDFTLGLLLAAVTAGGGAVCSTVLDFLPFALWLTGIVTGHVALGQIKHANAPGRGRAAWGLVLSYSGLFFIVVFIIVVVALIATGVGAGWLEKIFPISHSTSVHPF